MRETQSEDVRNHGVRVHIDQHPYTSPNPTTGIALYALAHIGDGLELFKEVEGDHEDAAVPKDATELHLKEDEHFHSGEARERKFRIIVNLEPKEVEQRVLTFREVVALAYPNPDFKPTIIYTVTYKRAVAPMHEGSLVEGEKVEIKNGTIFNVTKTDKS
jgi:Multiubiquitin